MPRECSWYHGPKSWLKSLNAKSIAITCLMDACPKSVVMHCRIASSAGGLWVSTTNAYIRRWHDRPSPVSHQHVNRSYDIVKPTFNAVYTTSSIRTTKMQLTSVFIATALLGTSYAYYLDKTCSNIEFESATNVLELDCNNKQGQPIHQTFDLDICLGWDASSQSIVYVR